VRCKASGARDKRLESIARARRERRRNSRYVTLCRTYVRARRDITHRVTLRWIHFVAARLIRRANRTGIEIDYDRRECTYTPFRGYSSASGYLQFRNAHSLRGKLREFRGKNRAIFQCENRAGCENKYSIEKERLLAALNAVIARENTQNQPSRDGNDAEGWAVTNGARSIALARMRLALRIGSRAHSAPSKRPDPRAFASRAIAGAEMEAQLIEQLEIFR